MSALRLRGSYKDHDYYVFESAESIRRKIRNSLRQHSTLYKVGAFLLGVPLVFYLGEPYFIQKKNDRDFVIVPPSCNVDSHLQEVFDDIAEGNKWNHKEAKKERPLRSRSGPGSDLDEAWKNAQQLNDFIISHDIKSFADVPCGDMMWQGAARQLNTIPVYFGGDLAAKVIDENKRTFSKHHNKLFEVWDLAKCPIPQFQTTDSSELQSFQMVLTRDVIMHLTFENARKFIKNVVLSPGIEYWAVTSFGRIKENKDIKDGKWSRYNVALEPFNLPKENIVFSELSHAPNGDNKSHQDANNDDLVIFKVDANLIQHVSKWE